MDENIKENIIKVIGIVIIIILLMCTISANTKYSKLENEVDGYKYEITNLEEKNNEYETLIESYKKSQLEDKAKITEQQETITNLETQIETKNNEIKKLNIEIVSLTKERDTATKQISNLNNQITNLNNTINDNKTTIETLNTKLANETNKLTNANNQISTLTTTNNTLNENITILETRLNSVNKYHVVNSEIELLEAFNTGGNIILNTDIIMSNTVVIKDKYLSIDLNGHNLVVTSINLDNTSLEIKDSTNTGNLNIVGDNDDLLKGIKVNSTSTLKITNGNYEGTNLFQILDNGTMYVVNGNFNNTQEEIINKVETSKVEILGGTFII